MKDWEPRPYQRVMLDFMARTPRCCLFVPMGFGKTSGVLWFVDMNLLAGFSRRVLVLAPLRVARSTWPDEVAKWRNFANIKAGFIEWTAAEQDFLKARRRLQRAVKDDESCTKPETLALMAEVDHLHVAAKAARLRETKSAQVWTINYDRVQELVDVLGDAWPYDTVVADESTRLKSTRTRQGGKWGRALSKVAFLPAVRRWINLTGTPAPNGLQDLWGQMYFVDRGSRLGASYSAFENRWFGLKLKKGSKMFADRVLLPHSEKEILTAVSDVCLTLNPKDWFDLKTPIFNTIYVDLPPEVRRQYTQVEREMFALIDGHSVTAVAEGAKSIKCLQIAAGAVYVEGAAEEWIDVHDEKIDALRSVVEEAAGAPVLVAYHFRSDLVRLQRAFPDARRLDADPRTIADWNAGRIPVLLAHPAAAGHGLSLQDGGNIVVFYTSWWALENYQQIIERIGPVRQMQSGYDRPVYVHHIVARRTTDEMVLKVLEGKATVQQVFLDAQAEFNRREQCSLIG